ncbi:MAG: GNAT family N-acetyltransferase [Paracoccaceae bacterium]
MHATLLPMALALLDAEDEGPAAFAAALGYPAPADWPPAFHTPATRSMFRRLIAGQPAGSVFISYYITADGTPIGTCGFKGPPDTQGMVEIGYAVVPSHQRQGHASTAIRQLLALAFADPRVTCVTAQTIPSLTASQRTVITCGFTLTQLRPDPDHGEVLTYTRHRP